MIPFRFSTICFHVVLLLAAVGMLSSCGRSESSRSLSEIESYMDSHSDSRLDDLLAIDSAALQSPGDRMLYEVLLTQALDKAHESIASRDSVMQVAADWFSDRSDTRHALLANYFLGRIKFEKKEYPESLVAMFKAHDLAKELDDKYWTGMSARGISDVYLITYNAADAVNYSIIELDNMKLSKRQPYINYAMFDLGTAYCANGQSDEAYNMLIQVVDSALKYDDEYLKFSAQESIIRVFLQEGRYREALNQLEDISDMPYFSHVDSTFLALCYLNCNDIPKAKMIMDEFGLQSDMHTFWIRYKVFKSLGDYKSALINKEYNDSLKTSSFDNRIGMNLIGFVTEYYNLKEHSRLQELKDSRTILWLFIVLIIFIVGISVYAGYSYHKSSKDKIERNLALAQSLQEMLDKKESEFDRAHGLLIGKLQSEFAVVDNLCRMVYESENQAAARMRVSKAVSKLIDELSEDKKKIEELEKSVNLVCNDVMVSFRTDFPNLKEADYNLFLYSILGFSPSAITLFLKEEKLTKVYERKRRLKDKIKKLDSPNREKYMDFLG